MLMKVIKIIYFFLLGVKPYQCQLCPAKFRTSGHRKAHLLNHMKNSTNKKPSNEMKLADLLDVLSDKNQQQALPLEQNNLPPQIVVSEFVSIVKRIERENNINMFCMGLFTYNCCMGSFRIVVWGYLELLYRVI